MRLEVITFLTGAALLGCGILYLKWISSIEERDDLDIKIEYVGKLIQNASFTYIKKQYIIIAILVLASTAGAYIYFKEQALFILTGAFTNLLASFVPMNLSLFANRQTAQAARISTEEAFGYAFRTSLLSSFFLSLLSIFSISLLLWTKNISENLLLFGLGSSIVSAVSRLGGGIFTKGADVGADLAGKIEHSLPEDDMRNPAAIADNVGDNVGDCANTASDLTDSILLALIISIRSNVLLCGSQLAILCIGLMSAALPIVFVFKLKTVSLWNRMQGYLGVSVGLMLLGNIGLFSLGYITKSILVSVSLGAITSVLLVKIAEYFTSSSFRPLHFIVEATRIGAGTNVIAGIGVSYLAVLVYGIVILSSISIGWIFAQELSTTYMALGMVSIAAPILSLDLIGPIVDNAGGIAEMAKLPEAARHNTDILDTIGNTTKATTKSYAICISVFCSIGLMFNIDTVPIYISTIIKPTLYMGAQIFGASIPFLFAALCMFGVGTAAAQVVSNIRDQLSISNLAEIQAPNYESVIEDLTSAAYMYMILIVAVCLGLMAIVAALMSTYFNVYTVLKIVRNMLMGLIVSGSLLSISLTTAGGAWDNAKKYLSSIGEKGTAVYKAAVVGDIIGDPFKDTAGPALNSFIKLTLLLSLIVFIQN